MDWCAKKRVEAASGAKVPSFGVEEAVRYGSLVGYLKRKITP